MANVINVVLRNISKTSNRLTLNISSNFLKTQGRSLYSPATLGLDAYKEQCFRTQSKLENIKDKFKSKMVDYTSDDTKNMIFTEDLKNMIHIAQEEDLDTVIKMINRFNEQNKELRFGNFIFGPVVMRMFHYWNKPDLALECFNSPNFEGFFDQLISYQLLLNLLFVNERYDDILKVFETIKERQAGGMKYPRNIVVLTMGACYKLNTKESLKFALQLWKELNEVGHLPLRRTITFCAALASKHEMHEAVLELLEMSKNPNYTTIRNLKVLSFMKIGRLDDVLDILKSVFLPQPHDKKQTFNKDVIEELKNGFEKCDSKEMKTEFARIAAQLQELELIDDKALDEQLCSVIATPHFLENRGTSQGKFYNNNRFQQGQRRDGFRRPTFNQRPGLEELQ